MSYGAKHLHTLFRSGGEGSVAPRSDTGVALGPSPTRSMDIIKSSRWPGDARLTWLSSLVWFCFVSFGNLFLSTLVFFLLRSWATSNSASTTLPLAEILPSLSHYRLFTSTCTPSRGHQSLVCRQQELLRKKVIAGTNIS